MRVYLIAGVAVLLCAGAAPLAAGRSIDSRTVTVTPVCRQAGTHFAGAAAGKAKVCFTLTASRRSMREYSYELCASSEYAGKAWSWRKPIPVRANGTFEDGLGIEEVAIGTSGPSFINVTFSGRILAARASGTLTGILADGSGTQVFRCTWTTHRLPR